MPVVPLQVSTLDSLQNVSKQSYLAKCLLCMIISIKAFEQVCDNIFLPSAQQRTTSDGHFSLL